MLVKRTTLLMIGLILLCVLLGLVFGYAGGIGIKTVVNEMIQNSKENAEKGTPVKSMTITIRSDQQELLFDQLRKFAQKNFFAIRIKDFKPSSYTVEMWREDIEIHGSFHNDSGILSLGFLRNNFEQPISQPVPVSVFEELMNDLQSFVSEVPSAITTERRHRLIIATSDNWRNEELLAQMKALAEKHSLKYEYSFDPSDNRCLDVEIYGEDFHLTTSDCERDTIEDFDIEFFLDYHRSPTAISKDTLDKLFNELRSVFGNIDNATVKEQP